MNKSDIVSRLVYNLNKPTFNKGNSKVCRHKPGISWLTSLFLTSILWAVSKRLKTSGLDKKWLQNPRDKPVICRFITDNFEKEF